MIKLPEHLLIDEQQWLTCFNKVSHLLQNVTFIFEQCGLIMLVLHVLNWWTSSDFSKSCVSLREREREREIAIFWACWGIAADLICRSGLKKLGWGTVDGRILIYQKCLHCWLDFCSHVWLHGFWYLHVTKISLILDHKGDWMKYMYVCMNVGLNVNRLRKTQPPCTKEKNLEPFEWKYF